MRINFALLGVVSLAIAAVVYGEYRKADVIVSSEPAFHLLGDTQQELTRLPVVLTRISDEEEIKIGNEMAKEYLQDWQDGIAKTPNFAEAQAYVDQVGQRVSSHARRKLPYKFHYIPDADFVNAFALPGGHVFVGQGLIQLMDSEDELAAVLGHEVEHVDMGHCAERVQLEARLRHYHLEEAGWLAAIPYQVFAAGYSKEQELAADRDGTQLAVASGYSAMGAVRLFQAFEPFDLQRRNTSTPAGELSSLALQSLQEYFKSHPDSQERVVQIQQLIANGRWPLVAERDLKIGYLGLTLKAQSALVRYDYASAIALATHSLALKPNQSLPLEVLYSAEMYTGEFAAAVDAAHKLLVCSGATLANEQRYAEALAAQRTGQRAVAEFKAAIGDTSDNGREMQTLVAIDAAGLALLSGDAKSLGQLAATVEQRSDSYSSSQEGAIHARIGHWYYLAQDYAQAVSQLSRAQELAPDHKEITLEMAWAALAGSKMQTARNAFVSLSSPEAAAGRAVTLWRMEERGSATAEEFTLLTDSKWANERWVSATYGSSVYKDLCVIETERKSRLKAAR